MTRDLFDLAETFSVVTGASGWLGSAMVEALAEAGSHVTAVARRREALEEMATPLRERGLSVRTLVADVGTPGWSESLAEVVEEYGRLNVLVNNAHVGRGGSLRTSTRTDFDEAFRLGVTAAWAGIEAAREGLTTAAQAGMTSSVINISSMYGLVAPNFGIYGREEGRNPPFYGAAKAGLLQLTRYASAELGPLGVRVNAISPGPFPSPAAQSDEAFVTRLAEHTTLGRVGKPQDLKTALLFLASPHSGFVTGTNIVVDGGWTTR